jgi:uncharacterized RDD family membrane protein YckC
MPQDSANTTHDVERVDVSMLSETQRDMLWMRLRGSDVMYVFDRGCVTVSASHAALLRAAVAWVSKEVRSPPRGYYPQPHPFQRTSGSGTVVAARWRRLTAACIDSVVVGMFSIIAHRLGLSPWMLIMLNAAYVIGMTARWGRTVGKFAIEIRVVDALRRRPPTWRQSAARWAAVGWISIVAGWVGGGADRPLLLAQVAIYAPALWDARGRGLHDRVAGTLVVTVPGR